jgi:hypothetical protein
MVPNCQRPNAVRSIAPIYIGQNALELAAFFGKSALSEGMRREANTIRHPIATRTIDLLLRSKGN